MYIEEDDPKTTAALPRKKTAVGTIGEANQLFTVYERNWNCGGIIILLIIFKFSVVINI